MSKNFTFYLLFSTLSIILLIINSNKKDIFLNQSIADNNFIISGKAKIIDGDSIMINKNEIRLFDIDSPEYKQICHDNKDNIYECGIAALTYLKKLTLDKKLNCHIVGKDYYDRYLATCFDKKININAQMIASGWAVTYNNPSKYYPLMLKAKISKIGLWQGKFLEPKQYRKLHRK